MAKPDKYLIYTAEHLKAVATHEGDVIVEFDLPEFGLTPGVVLAIRMLPHEAREVAKLLVQKAREAESE